MCTHAFSLNLCTHVFVFEFSNCNAIFLSYNVTFVHTMHHVNISNQNFYAVPCAQAHNLSSLHFPYLCKHILCSYLYHIHITHLKTYCVHITHFKTARYSSRFTNVQNAYMPHFLHLLFPFPH